MADPDPIESMKRLLDNLRPNADQAMLLSSINQALSDLVMLLEKRPEPKAPDIAPIVEAIKAIKLASPVQVVSTKPRQWRIDAPVDVAGRPTGQMTLTEVL
jgi:hypothetical protein